MRPFANRIGDRSPTLFLLSSLTIGGSERKMVRLANDLACHGWPVTLAYLNEPSTLASSIHDNVQVFHLRRRGKLSLTALNMLMQLIRDHKIRNVVAVNLYAALYAILAKQFLRKRELYVVVSINTTEFVTKAEERQMLFYRWVLRLSDRLIFGAAVQRDLWCGRYKLRCNAERALVLYNGVDTVHFDPVLVKSVSRDQLPNSTYVFGTVGKLRVEKAHIDIVQAVHALRARGVNAGAILVGDGPQRGPIAAEIERLGMGEFVIMTGEVLDVRPWLAAMDVFVLTSVSETFSNSALEAMSMARPIVSSCVGGMKEMLQFGGGTTYRAGDIGGLCERLGELSSDAIGRARLGVEARQIAIERFGWNGMVEEYANRVFE